MKSFFLLLIMVSSNAFCQPTYLPNEVSKTAEPSGGVTMLNEFIKANLQISIRSAAKGLNGGVFIKGIVEIDGRMTNLEVTRSLDSLIDREALRLLHLYRAWKPAIREGQAVRQIMTYPVFFRTAALPTYDPDEELLYEYFDKNHLPTSDTMQYAYRSKIPVDERGFIKNEAEYQQSRKGKWKTISKLPFHKEEFWFRFPSGTRLDSIRAFKIFADPDTRSGAREELIVQSDGKILAQIAYPGGGKPSQSSRTYYFSGVLKEERSPIGLNTTRIVDWYENGLLHTIMDLEDGIRPAIGQVWDQAGNQMVQDGNGWAKISVNPYDEGIVYEEGQVQDSLKTGRWTGKLADSTLMYEEFYESGKFQKGVANVEGTMVEYEKPFTSSPQFKGENGVQDMYRFLAQNIRYPVEAMRSKITGKIILSFMVNQDGSTSDFKIEKGVHKSLDQEALRVAKLTDGHWQSAHLKGRAIRMRYTLPITFNAN
jgi:TonB family protein